MVATGVVPAVVAVAAMVPTTVVRYSRSRRGGGCGGSSLGYGGEAAQRGRKRKHELFHRNNKE